MSLVKAVANKKGFRTLYLQFIILRLLDLFATPWRLVSENNSYIKTALTYEGWGTLQFRALLRSLLYLYFILEYS